MLAICGAGVVGRSTKSVFAPSSRAKLVGKLVLPPTPAVLGASRSTDLVLIKPPNELESVRSN